MKNMYNKIKLYGIYGSLRLLVSLLYTKLFYPQAKIIRLPFDIRNSHKIKIGNNFVCGFGCRLEVHPKNEKINKCLILEDNVEINDYVHIAAGEKVVIGKNVLIASKVFISDINHGSYSKENQDSPHIPPATRKLSTDPIYIGENVWIGESVCVLPGARIGRGSIIGSLSVVTKDIPQLSIAVGIPAKVIKRFDEKQQKWISVS